MIGLPKLRARAAARNCGRPRKLRRIPAGGQLLGQARTSTARNFDVAQLLMSRFRAPLSPPKSMTCNLATAQPWHFSAFCETSAHKSGLVRLDSSLSRIHPAATALFRAGPLSQLLLYREVGVLGA